MNHDKKRHSNKILGMLILAGAIFWLFIGIVIIPPIGAAPKGVTLVVWKGAKLSNCETLDSIQRKSAGKASLLGRMVVLGMLAKNEKIIFRLPYSKTLHEFCE